MTEIEELCARVEALEACDKEDANCWQAVRASMHAFRTRVEALEATQHAHVEAKAAEAGARCAVEQIRSKPGRWKPFNIDTEITYGDARAAATAEQILRAPIVVEGTFEHGGETYRFKAKPERETTYGTAPIVVPSPAGLLVDRVADAIAAADDEGLTNMTWSNHSRAAILEVAAWIRSELNGRNVADRLEQEANR